MLGYFNLSFYYVIMFITPMMSNIENVDFVVLLSLKSSCSLYFGTDATSAAKGRIDSKELLPVSFISKQACAMFELIFNHDTLANTSSMTLAG